MKKIKSTAWVSINAPGMIIGTATNFKSGEYFEITGTRGNVWIFNIDEVLKQALKHKNKDYLRQAKQVYDWVHSDSGLNIGAPLADLVSNIGKEFGDDVVVALNQSDGNPDDREEKYKKSGVRDDKKKHDDSNITYEGFKSR